MNLVMRHERIQRGWTQQYVGSQIGITAEAVGMIETGQRNPSYTVLVKLENLFDLPYRRLFAVTDDTPNHSWES